MFGFHKPKMCRRIGGCCICRAKSSSSRFTDSKRYEEDFQSCFGLHETRSGDICNAHVLLVKRWKKLPAGSKKNLESQGRCKGRTQPEDCTETKESENSIWKQDKKQPDQQTTKKFKHHNSDAHSTTSSASQLSLLVTVTSQMMAQIQRWLWAPAERQFFSYLDLTYWKRQKICCGIIYKGRFGEVLIDTLLFKPCCSNKKAAAKKPEPGPEPLPISTQEW